ncbi:MAG: 16S rRNA (guanine(527)-N(7))-methyltransferase RsmG [Gammaproteobacteria bacterium]|nr:MAG: 16S rRNA (guanine(527)-N(7))-methyltransferase RsmG [Gammaproteobacteria bacterium]
MMSTGSASPRSRSERRSSSPSAPGSARSSSTSSKGSVRSTRAAASASCTQSTTKPSRFRPARMASDAASLGVRLTDADAGRLLALLEELARWNRSYNLTGIRTLGAMVTHHLLDSLAIHPDLEGTRIADVGTGAGFPGLPLAVANPARHFTLIDSTAKKIRFVSHAAETLGLANVTALQARVETMHPAVAFDTVVARAIAPLPKLLAQVRGLVAAHSRLLAMKGRWPEKELEALPSSWRLVGSRELTVPRLGEARCVLVLALAVD